LKIKLFVFAVYRDDYKNLSTVCEQVIHRLTVQLIISLSLAFV